MSENTTTTPPVTPEAPLVTPQMVQNTYTLAMVFAIISLVTFFWLAPVALGLGIAALVLVNKGRKQTIAAGEQPPRNFTPQFVMGLIGLIAGAIVTLIYAAMLLFALVGTGFVIKNSIDQNGRSEQNGSYAQSVAVAQGAQKEFTSSETVEFGPYDLTVQNDQEKYTPTAAEKSDMTRGFGSASEYRKITIDVSRNEARTASYAALSMTHPGSWGRALDDADMAQSNCVWYSVPSTTLRQLDYPKKETSTPLSFDMICKSSGNNDTLKLTVGVFTKILPIVGTEGAPSTELQYSVAF